MNPTSKIPATPLLMLAPDGCSMRAPLPPEREAVLHRFRITELMNRYAVAHNTSDLKGYADLFTEDAVLQDQTMCYEFARGRAAILDAAEKGRVHFNPSATGDGTDLTTSRQHHLITNTVVTLNGDGTALGLCYVTTLANKPDFGPLITSHGY